MPNRPFAPYTQSPSSLTRYPEDRRAEAARSRAPSADPLKATRSDTCMFSICFTVAATVGRKNLVQDTLNRLTVHTMRLIEINVSRAEYHAERKTSCRLRPRMTAAFARPYCSTYCSGGPP